MRIEIEDLQERLREQSYVRTLACFVERVRVSRLSIFELWHIWRVRQVEYHPENGVSPGHKTNGVYASGAVHKLRHA